MEHCTHLCIGCKYMSHISSFPRLCCSDITKYFGIGCIPYNTANICDEMCGYQLLKYKINWHQRIVESVLPTLRPRIWTKMVICIKTYNFCTGIYVLLYLATKYIELRPLMVGGRIHLLWYIVQIIIYHLKEHSNTYFWQYFLLSHAVAVSYKDYSKK